MKKLFFKKAFFGASVASMAAAMVFAIPAFSGPDFEYESGTNYRYPSQRDYSQGSTSPYRRYQPEFDRAERDSRDDASEFPRTSRGYGENRRADREFGRADEREYSEGSTYRGDTGYRGYYGDSSEDRDLDEYYQGRYGRPSYRNYRENMAGRGGRQPEPRYGQSRQQQETGETGQEMFDRSRRRQQFDDSGQQQYGRSDRRQFGDSGQQPYDQQQRRQQFGDSGQQQYGRSDRQQFGDSGQQQYDRSQRRQQFGDSGQQPYDQQQRRQQFGDSGQQQYDRSQRRQQFGDSGQQQYDQQQRRQQFGDSGQQQYDRSDQRQFSRRQPQQDARDQAQWRVEPEGWVRIGYDFDNDNQVDAYEWISVYELEKAREGSRRRESARRSGQQGQQDQRFSTGMERDRFERGYYQQRSGRQSRQQMRRGDQIQGSIKEMKTISLSKMDEDHVIARIQTRDGQVAKVDLGPEQKISDLNLQKGDQVTVHGITGSINQKPVLMAHGVEAKGQRVSVKRPQDMNLKSYSGQILKTRKTSIREDTPTVLMARIRMDDGNTTMVNLGPEKELRDQLDIEEGKRFSMLARPVRINGRKGLVAEFVKIGDKSVDVDWQKAKKGNE